MQKQTKTPPTPLVFTVGDRVKWLSQSKGSWLEKRGVIAEVVPAGRSAKMPLKNPGGTRSDVSYVVNVPEERPDDAPRGWKPRSSKFYWPRTSQVKRIGKPKA